MKVFGYFPVCIMYQGMGVLLVLVVVVVGVVGVVMVIAVVISFIGDCGEYQIHHLSAQPPGRKETSVYS